MRKLIEMLDAQFNRLDRQNREFISLVPPDKLYFQPRAQSDSSTVLSCGEYILRSAGKVEQTFGGITAKLWDDPFEWTLPEALSNNAKIIEYLNEVEATRQRGFALFQNDEDLRREIPAPTRLRTIFELLIETYGQAENFQGRAFAVFRLLADAPLPR